MPILCPGPKCREEEQVEGKVLPSGRGDRHLRHEPPHTVGFGVRNHLRGPEREGRLGWSVGLGRAAAQVRKGRARPDSPREMCAFCSTG